MFIFYNLGLTTMFFSLLFMFEIVKRGLRTYRHIVNCWSHCNWWQFAHWQEKGKDPQDLIFMTSHFFPFLNCRPQDSLGVTSALHFLNVLLSIVLCSEGYVKLEILVLTPEIARWLIFLKSFLCCSLNCRYHPRSSVYGVVLRRTEAVSWCDGVP